MSMSVRELWALFHGVVFGGLFLLSFSGGLVGLYMLRSGCVTHKGFTELLRLLRVGTTIMAVVAWLTVIIGSYVVYPWYRAEPPEGADLELYPRSFLKASPHLVAWHNFGMEWKEHIAWFTPILATAVAYIVWRYGDQLTEDGHLRKMFTAIFTLAFVAAGIAGLLGALITKYAPIH